MRIIWRYKKSFIAVTIIVLSFYFFCYHYTGAHEFGMTQNLITGEIAPDGHSGHHFSPPWVLAVKIDTRPLRVCVPSASHNLNAMLIQFDQAYYEELVSVEGFHYYWWYNRFSFNSGQETFRGTENMLLGHAYGSKKMHFVKILKDLNNELN